MTSHEFALSDLAARLAGTDASLSTALRDILAAALHRAWESVEDEPVAGVRAEHGFEDDGTERRDRTTINPRCSGMPQATAAYEVASRHGITLNAVVLLDLPLDLLTDRLTARGEQTGRADDTLDTIRHRIEVYLDKTLPLVDYYAGRHILCRVDATGTIDEVTARVFAAVDNQLTAAT